MIADHPATSLAVAVHASRSLSPGDAVRRPSRRHPHRLHAARQEAVDGGARRLQEAN